jgi:hypothetical protein
MREILNSHLDKTHDAALSDKVHGTVTAIGPEGG